MKWKNIYRGFTMGTSDLVPGVSGGTIAVLLGIYNELIAAINGIFSKDWKKHIGFLIPLGVGMVLAIFTLSRVMKWLLLHYQAPTFMFFLGLILGILPFLFREADVKNTFKVNHIIILLIAATLIAMMGFLNDDIGAVIVDRSLSTYVLFLFAGFLGSAAMVLPGVSGSFMLLVIGVHSTVINAISDFEFDVIIVVGVGILIGIIVMSKIINYFLTQYRTGTFAVIIGMVIGSIVVIFPGWPTSLSTILVSLLVFLGGILTAYLLGKVEYKA